MYKTTKYTKKQDDNLDKITVLRFWQNEYIINTSDELKRK